MAPQKAAQQTTLKTYPKKKRLTTSDSALANHAKPDGTRLRPHNATYKRPKALNPKPDYHRKASGFEPQVGILRLRLQKVPGIGFPTQI